MKLNLKERNGITLIALVITIIVLLILAGVTIATLTGDNGILGKAKTAKTTNDEEKAKEQINIAVMGSYGKDGELNYDDLTKNLRQIGIKGLPKEASYPLEVTLDGVSATIKANGEVNFTTSGGYTQTGDTITSPDGKTMKVGDYVDYNPTIASKDGTKVEESKLSYTSPTGTASEHGNGYSEQTFKATKNTQWRVLSIENGTVELISRNGIKTFDKDLDFFIKGARGYLYAEQELNEVCKIFGYGYGADTTKGGSYTVGGPLDTLVTGKIEGTGARSITVEDINKIAGVYEENGQMKYSDGTIINSNYGDTTKPTENIKFPTIDINKGDNITGISKLAQLKNVKNTEYSYKKDKMANQDISEILFENNYWLASRSINTESMYSFCVSFVFGQNVYIGYTGVCYDLDGDFIERDLSGTIRPIVTLKKNVIDLSNIDSNPEGINVWHLK